MKKIIFLIAVTIIHVTLFSQGKLKDGIYLIDQSQDKPVAAKSHRAAIEVNPFFFEGDPELYKPLIVRTEDFVPLELADMPVIQYQKDGDNQVLVHLTGNATEKLRTFTTTNMMNHIVVIVNEQAVAVYKVVQPVISGYIRISRCSGGACSLIYKQLRVSFKI